MTRGTANAVKCPRLVSRNIISALLSTTLQPASRSWGGVINIVEKFNRVIAIAADAGRKTTAGNFGITNSPKRVAFLGYLSQKKKMHDIQEVVRGQNAIINNYRISLRSNAKTQTDRGRQRPVSPFRPKWKRKQFRNSTNKDVLTTSENTRYSAIRVHRLVAGNLVTNSTHRLNGFHGR